MRDSPAMRGVERIADLRRVAQHGLDRKGSVKRLPVNVLHDEVIGSDVVECANIRMIQVRDRPRLALEPVAEPLTAHFDGDSSSQTRVAGAIHLAHAARAQQSLDLVRSQTRSSGELHSYLRHQRGWGKPSSSQMSCRVTPTDVAKLLPSGCRLKPATFTATG